MKKPSPPSWRWQAALIVLPVVVLAVMGEMGLREMRRHVMEEAQTKAQRWCEARYTFLHERLLDLVSKHPTPQVFTDPPKPRDPQKAVSVEELESIKYPAAGQTNPSGRTIAALADRRPLRTLSGLPTEVLLEFKRWQQAPSESLARSLRHLALYDQSSVISPSVLEQADPHNATGWREAWTKVLADQPYLRLATVPGEARRSLVIRKAPARRTETMMVQDGGFWLFGPCESESGDPGTGMCDYLLVLSDISNHLSLAGKLEQKEMHHWPSSFSSESFQWSENTEESWCELRVSLGPHIEPLNVGDKWWGGEVMATHGMMPRVHALLRTPESLFAAQQRLTVWFTVVLGLSILSALTGLWMLRRTILRERALSDMKTNFIASVTHELRAPVASLQLLSEGLEAGTVSDEVKRRDYFRLMVEECRRLGGLISNVLDLSRIERGSREFHFEESDLRALVLDTAKLHEPRASSLGITLQTETTDLDPPPVVDAMAIQQALTNLIDNALKFAPRGSTVLVTLSQSDPQRWRLSVQDDGPGVPEAERERVFDAFHRVGSELRRETQGVGIGLAIVKHVVEAHHGRVWVEGEPTRFIIECPNITS